MDTAGNIKYSTVEEYFSAFPKQVADLLEELRKIIQQTAPDAQELISYNMPAFKLNGMLVYYAAYKHHIGFYPTSSGIRVFEDDLKDYKTSKGAIQFPIEKGIPSDLVKRIVEFRVQENQEKALLKKAGKK
ncbi:Uncharacterized conserved protein YdhG, YjbR/CyaY-like superfamily, DUF1801 family [Pseudarcicella hirudinis]|uniref:Uncharacterized conserved protein YdhG, YjbR/CyaY-like superfamily, DUF1801 family n=1 Tax=Pseudarcicella hirudinis TaxID=1079859 RepID=A0A1I5N604_9BACT|nr:DUF1801 domain-containing protein [Pseudarcicella hirudinis]SFP17137.1 Uncharacterized conserved protein YdhG, YjbR/CyaY-like superfamily, DUF1801 family [Pseudarcicella hirudinis]